MLSIELENLGKRFNREWIFRKLNYSIQPAEKIVITGANGSGKSTLLQVLSGYVVPTEGKNNFYQNNSKIEIENYYKNLSIASPYLELIEEYSLTEIIKHQQIFKPFQQNFSGKYLIELAELEKAKDKTLKLYSSGMKQRVKLMLAVMADCPLLLLDEPTTNFDKNAIAWYKNLIIKYAMHKTIIVCSNKIEDEYEFCSKELKMEEYK